MTEETPTEKTKPSRSIVTPSDSTRTHGSSSTTTGSNVQSVASNVTPNYTNLQSANPLTQGSNRGQVPFSNNISQVASAQSPTTRANPTTLGIHPSASTVTTSYQRNASVYALVTPSYGSQLASKINLSNFSMTGHPTPAQNVDNIYFNPESASVRNATRRQNKFVDNNQFDANPQSPASAPIPTKIYTRTNLFDQAGEKDNPLSIMEGNPFIAPSHQYLPQVNEEFAPRPKLSSFTNSPFIGVHQRSPLAPNADDSVSQRKGVADWFGEMKTYTISHPVPVGLAVVLLAGLWFVALRGRN